MPINPAGETVGIAQIHIASRLEKCSATSNLDAQVLLAHVTGRRRTWLAAHPETPISPGRAKKLEDLVQRLELGEPLPYVLGKWEFFGLEFEVSPDVLIPRPETELMVERGLAWLKSNPGQHHAADVGTGSGCIGIALAAGFPGLQVTATDISAEALILAQRNAVKNGVAERMNFVCCDFFPADTEFDLIIANLPYIPTRTLHRLQVYGREPTLALDGGADGLNLIRRFLTEAPDKLVSNGLLLMEIEESEGSLAVSLACDSFGEADIHLRKDLAGLDRILEILA